MLVSPLPIANLSGKPKNVTVSGNVHHVFGNNTTGSNTTITH